MPAHSAASTMRPSAAWCARRTIHAARWATCRSTISGAARIRAGPGHGRHRSAGAISTRSGDRQADAVLGQGADMSRAGSRSPRRSIRSTGSASWQAYAAKVGALGRRPPRTRVRRLLVFPEYGAMELASLFPEPVPGDLHGAAAGRGRARGAGGRAASGAGAPSRRLHSRRQPAGRGVARPLPQPRLALRARTEAPRFRTRS